MDDLYTAFSEGIDTYTEKYDYYLGFAERRELADSIMASLASAGFGFTMPSLQEEEYGTI